MYDTIRGKIRVPWTNDLRENPPEGWDIKQGMFEDDDGKPQYRRTAVHKITGMYIKGDQDFSHVIQVSLPRMMFGDNTELCGSLICYYETKVKEGKNTGKPDYLPIIGSATLYHKINSKTYDIITAAHNFV